MGWVFVYVIKNLKKQDDGKSIAHLFADIMHGIKNIQESKKERAFNPLFG